jgi:DNA-binding response OmpR family regulator
MSGKRILVVEDTKNIRQIVVFMLKKRGYEVFEAEDGDDGYEKAKAIKPDLMVLDAMLPGRTGFEICGDLKADPAYSDIPIIMLTAITQDTDQTDDYWKEKAGADDFMSKPFRAQELLERIQKLLGEEVDASE